MISVLMATYNGEEYLKEQLDSLLKQTVQEFKIYVSDDCSTDRTWSILESYKMKHPDKFIIKRRDINSGNAKYNFLDMMIHIKDDYVMLCDQDDVWLPNKVKLTLTKMEEMEQSHGKNVPILVHTDLVVVDEGLKTINSSFKQAMNANYDRTSLNQVIIQNTLTGCTGLYNRALSDLLYDMPEYCIMHDWWIVLVASAFGKIDYVDEQTILYRQHEGNEIGAKDVRTFSYKIDKLMHGKEVKKAINDTYIQAEAFLKMYSEELSEKEVSLLETYIKIPSMNKWNRWKTIVNLGSLKNGFSRKIANFIFI